MTDKELRRLSRADLVDIIYQLQQDKETLISENEQMKEQMSAEKEQLLSKLRSREIKAAKAGSLADAAASLTGLFERAQTTADLYLENIAEMKKEEEMKLAEIRGFYEEMKHSPKALKDDKGD